MPNIIALGQEYLQLDKYTDTVCSNCYSESDCNDCCAMIDLFDIDNLMHKIGCNWH